jgi:hypothetical protein
MAAAHRGWPYALHTRSCREFESLHARPEWDAVLRLIEENRNR